MISERDYAPLSAACVRSLNDKMYEKRKAAALEIEKMVKEFATHNNTAQIKRLLKVLGQDFAMSQNPHTRKGGLIGLAAIAIALGKDTGQYTEDLIHPILACFCDSDLRVRYSACESLYNVVKVARGAVLPQFTDIFGALSKLACDSEQSVKNGTELLDRLMKDIVTESGMFDLVGFMPLLRERIYTKNQFGRQFVIAWVSVLGSVPDMDFITFLPEILDGLFRILEDPTPEIKKVTDTVLGEFLRNIKSNPTRVDFPGMINILITHAQNTDELLQLTAITWIKEFVHLSGPLMLPYTSGIFTAVLPCLAYDSDSRKNIKETATQVNGSLMKLITMESSEMSDKVQTSVVENVDSNGQKAVQSKCPLAEKLDLPSVVEVLTKHLMHTSVQTKVAVLKWIHHLFTSIPYKMFHHIDDLFPVLMRTLSDSSDDVVQQNLVVMAEIINSKSSETTVEETSTARKNKYYTKFIVNLLRLFSTDRHLLEERGAFIIRELCVLLSAEDIYKILAEILLEEQNLRFACIMVQTLNVILLTSSELFDLRNKLKDLDSEVKTQCNYKTDRYGKLRIVRVTLLIVESQSRGDRSSVFFDSELCTRLRPRKVLWKYGGKRRIPHRDRQVGPTHRIADIHIAKHSGHCTDAWPRYLHLPRAPPLRRKPIHPSLRSTATWTLKSFCNTSMPFRRSTRSRNISRG
ncbi:protein VAC14 homolog isoform X4 [Orussus abietinus]|uniref:protein VAC14 homolog isoform X4 n=1 Tax=Orussus abietinus TaxID=222816 RepID=UPI000C715BB3|nr:protein VAC14 homolog isoform X4 [Orussus abietinus]